MPVFDDEDIYTNSGAVAPEVLGKKELTNARSRLRSSIHRDLANYEKRQRKAASDLLQQAMYRYQAANSAKSKERKHNNAVAYTITELAKAVMKTLDVDADVDVRPQRAMGGPVQGGTNFDSITIQFNPNFYNPDDIDSVVLFIKCLKGVIYHETGHLKFTVPMNRLMSEVDFRNATAVFSAEFLNRPETADFIGKQMRSYLLLAWNVLEDQRMETAMCSVSPVMATYFTEIVKYVVIDYEHFYMNWPWIVGRTYLPKELRQRIRDAAQTHPRAELIDSINDCVMRYRASRDYKEMMDCVVQFAELLAAWGVEGPTNPDTHDHYGTWANSKITPESIPVPDEFELENGPSYSSKIDDTSDYSGQSGTTHARGGVDPNSGSESSSATEQHATYNIADKDRKEAQDFIANTNEVCKLDILPNRTKQNMNDTLRKKAIDVSNSMLDALEDLRSQGEPSWVFRQEEGVLDPTSYLTREPGDTDYWVGLIGDVSPGHDLAVSVIIDSSGSMEEEMEEVSVAAVGVKKACYELGIPCTVMSFDDTAEMMFGATDSYEFQSISSKGSTHPVTALLDLDNQKLDKTYHLVIILTDGEWSDIKSVSPWSGPTRNIILVGFRMTRADLVDKGADNVLIIQQAEELPRLITNALVGYFI